MPTKLDGLGHPFFGGHMEITPSRCGRRCHMGQTTTEQPVRINRLISICAPCFFLKPWRARTDATRRLQVPGGGVNSRIR